MATTRGYVNGGDFFSNLTKPVEIDLSWTVAPANANGLGITGLKSNGYVRNVFMNTSQTPGSNNGYTNPNPVAGYAYVQLQYNFNSYINNFFSISGPLSGTNINISGTGVLTLGSPYVITSVGAVPAPKFTITTVADVAGSLAGTYFLVSDAFSNNYVLYNVVSGVGLPPSLTGALANYVAIPVTFASGSTSTTVAAAIVTALGAVNNSNSFTVTNAANVVTATSKANSNLVLSPSPTAGTSGFTVSGVVFRSLAADWNSVGLQVGLTPTVGQSFIATATGGALGSGVVQTQTASQIADLQVIGTPNVSIANSNIAADGGAWFLLEFLAPTSTSNPTLIPTAPSVNSVVALTLKLDASGVTIDGL